MNELKYALLAVGTLAFFATVYLAIRHPELVDVPGQARQDPGKPSLRKWDDIISWTMWGTWGCAALIILLDQWGVFEMFES